MRKLATAVAAVVWSGVLLGPVAGASAQAATCRGQAATIESGAASVVGTPGNDVIVATGKRTTVLAGAGDDVICYVGFSDSLVLNGGDGNDVVDTTGLDAPRFAAQIYLGSGRDRVIGGPAPESVSPGDFERPGGPEHLQPGEDVIDTGDGPDVVAARPGDVVSTGAGKDQVSALVGPTVGPTTAPWKLGRGRDLLVGDGRTSAAVKVSLEAGVFRIDDVTVPIAAAEDVSAFGGVVSVRGNMAANEVAVEGCTVTLRGGAGDDRLSLDRISDGGPVEDCTPTSRMWGQAGDDRTSGRDGRDVLLGGPGRDLAQGREGRDTCRAAVARNCETR